MRALPWLALGTLAAALALLVALVRELGGGWGHAALAAGLLVGALVLVVLGRKT